MKAKIRALLERLGEFPADPGSLRDDADLHAAGLSSYGTVQLMASIEEEFGVEFPDALLTRATFGSVNSVAAAVASLLGQNGATAEVAESAAQ